MSTVDRYDEAKSADGNVRAHWRGLNEQLEQFGPSGIEEQSATIEQLVRENGTTFRIESSDGQTDRPWQLSAVPLLIDPDSWAKLEAGLIQRTRLLESVLDDLLGPQQLIKEGIIPADVLWANPYFHRAYHGLPKTAPHRLDITATDVARANDGGWWVTGDRTRAPSGLGYMLENRIVTGRIYPQLIRRSNTRRLALFFEALRDHLRSLAPRMRENPRVALLTPGDHSYREFEDAGLARYLGLTLVQGKDLAVRNGNLNLKTLGGLLPVEVVWRHISDRKSDPLELAPDSVQGVTGLMQSVRDGNVAVANTIGSVMAQVPALMPFLASASRLLLGETPALPSIATYWCGGKKECSHVLANLDSLMIRPAFAVTGAAPVLPSELTAGAKEELVQAIRSDPRKYIAQERIAHSTTPVWQDGKMQSWHVALRCFQLQSQQGIQVAPGAMARLSPHEHELYRSPVSGQLTQDCWVCNNGPVDTETSLLVPADAMIKLKRGGDELPSRVAENLFWLGRYAERGESITRLLRATLLRVSGDSELEDLTELPRLVAALAALGQIAPDYAVAPLGGSLPSLEQALPRSVTDPFQPRGLHQTMKSVITNARMLRDRLSYDAYRILLHASHTLDFPRAERNPGRIIEQLNHLVADWLSFAGIATESTTRTHAWRFLLLGRRIERAFQTSELLSASLVPSTDDERPILEAVLETTDSLMTYRSRYLNLVRVAPTIDLLVTDETNPRSIRFQLEEIVNLLRTLPTDDKLVGLGADEKLADDLLHHLRMADPHVLKQSEDQRRETLEVLLRKMIDGLPILSDAIAARYLIHTGVTQVITGVVPPTQDQP